MRIGIDGGVWCNRRGYGRFLRELLRAVARAAPQHEYVVFLDSECYSRFEPGDRIHPVRVGTTRPVSVAASAQGSRSLADLLRMSRAVSRAPLDLLFFPADYSYFPIPPSIPTVLCIHDTIAHRNPGFAFASWRHWLLYKSKVRLAIAQADTIVTVSQYSKRCLTELLGIAPGRMEVVYEAASARFQKIEGGAPEPFILYAGGISPNKNLATLLRAYARLRTRQPRYKLILAGDYRFDRFKGCYPQLRSLVENLGLDNAVLFTGFVPDDELIRLFNRTSLFVLPSYDEGFGLPALEAMACGAPVIVSSGNALEEIVGNAGIVMPAGDETGLAEAMDRVLSDSELAAAMRERSLRRSAEFSWDRAAAQFVEIFERTHRARKGRPH